MIIPKIGINDNIRATTCACVGIILMNFVFLINNISITIRNTCTINSMDVNVMTIYGFYLPIKFLLMYSLLMTHAGSAGVPNNFPALMHLSDGTISYILNIPRS